MREVRNNYGTFWVIFYTEIISIKQNYSSTFKSGEAHVLITWTDWGQIICSNHHDSTRILISFSNLMIWLPLIVLSSQHLAELLMKQCLACSIVSLACTSTICRVVPRNQYLKNYGPYNQAYHINSSISKHQIFCVSYLLVWQNFQQKHIQKQRVYFSWQLKDTVHYGMKKW